MPINTKHPEYNTWLPVWQRCRDAYAGTDAVKARGPVYLPVLSGHTNETDKKYQAYKTRALFVEAMERTVEALAGMATRRQYDLEAPTTILDLLDDIDNSDTHLRDFVKSLFDEMLITSRYLVVADHDGDRPYMVGYPAENVINWNYNDQGLLDLLVVTEVGYVQDVADKYKLVEQTTYREFYLEARESGEGYNAFSQVWGEVRKGGAVSHEKIGDPTALVRVGENLGYLPALFLNPKGTGAEIVKPLLLGMVNIGFSHYRNSADYEHGLHFTALPTPWFAGLSRTMMDLEDPGNGDDAVTISMGSENAILIPDASGKAGMLEFSGQGLAALQAAMNDKIALMAVLGARVLETQKAVAEAAETKRLNASGDTSVLSNLVGAVERVVANALGIMAFWGGGGYEDVTFTLSRDLLDVQIDPGMLTAQLAALQQSAISLDTFLHNLKVGGLLPEGVTVDDEKARIGLRSPAGRVPLDPAGGFSD